MTVPTDLRDRADAATYRRIAIEAIDALDESLEHTELVTALRTRLASANVPEPQEWIEYDRSVVLDDGPILVYLAADLLQARIHTARVVRGPVPALSKAVVRLGPLRKVVAEFHDENGVQRERLECGHVINRKQDAVGYTNATRRRCRYCRGHLTATKET